MYKFEGYNLILTSKSPRRKQLLEEAGLSFIVKTIEVEEYYPPNLSAVKVPGYLASLKANANKGLLNDKTILIAADTIVCMDDVIYGKPKNLEEAKRVLKQLSGKNHEVITGVCLKSQEQELVFSATSKVYFKTLTDAEIEHYVETYKPLDKAGAYAIQEWIGLIGIERIEGSYANIIGLPVSQLLNELAKFKISLKNK